MEIVATSNGYRNESYQLTVRIDLIRSAIGPNISYCTLERIWKASNQSESPDGIFIRRGRVHIVNETNRIVHLNRSGTVHLRCYSGQRGALVLQYVYRILPLDMSVLKVLREEDRRNVEKMTEAFNSTQTENPGFSCGRFLCPFLFLFY